MYFLIGRFLGLVRRVLCYAYILFVLPFIVAGFRFIRRSKTGMLTISPKLFRWMVDEPFGYVGFPHNLWPHVRHYTSDSSVAAEVVEIYKMNTPQDIKAERARVLTIMAALQGFPIPAGVCVLDSRTKRLWRVLMKDMRIERVKRITIGSVLAGEALPPELELPVMPTAEDREAALRLSEKMPLILALLMRYGKHDFFPNWNYFYAVFLRAAKTNKFLYTENQVKSLITAAAVRYAVKIPRAYLLYDVMTFAIIDSVVGENPATEEKTHHLRIVK